MAKAVKAGRTVSGGLEEMGVTPKFTLDYPAHHLLGEYKSVVKTV